MSFQHSSLWYLLLLAFLTAKSNFTESVVEMEVSARNMLSLSQHIFNWLYSSISVHKVGSGKELHKQSGKQTTMELMLNKHFCRQWGRCCLFWANSYSLNSVTGSWSGIWVSSFLAHKNLILHNTNAEWWVYVPNFEKAAKEYPILYWWKSCCYSSVVEKARVRKECMDKCSH